MFDFALPADTSDEERYRELANAGDSLTDGESDAVANMANLAALIWSFVPDLNWAGFYRVVDGELVLGPFIGRPACIRIPFGQGVCGTAASSGETQLVEDVHAFPGHIACSSSTRSEIVLPVRNKAGEVIGVLDIDSNQPAAFDQKDQAALESLLDAVFGSLPAAKP